MSMYGPQTTLQVEGDVWQADIHHMLCYSRSPNCPTTWKLTKNFTGPVISCVCRPGHIICPCDRKVYIYVYIAMRYINNEIVTVVLNLVPHPYSNICVTYSNQFIHNYLIASYVHSYVCVYAIIIIHVKYVSYISHKHTYMHVHM